MATAIGDLVINLMARNQVSGAVKDITRDLGRFNSFAHGAVGQVNGVLSGIGGAAGLGGLMAGGGLAAGVAGTMALYREQINAENKLAAVLNATQGAAGLSMQALKEYASALQNVTNFGDEATLSSMAVLATFKEIKADIFKNAIAAAQDMSTVMGQSLQSSAVQLGKALNDPIQGLTALSRVGVSFTEQQKAQIKALQEAGDVAGAQRIILAELKSEFGGAAQAMADPVTQAKNALGDLGETLGGRVVPYVKAAAIGMRDLAGATAEAQQAATGLTNAEIAQMGVLERFTSFDWWAKGAADLAEVAKQTAKLGDAVLIEPVSRLASGQEAGDPLGEWWEQLANSRAPSELIDEQIQEMRRKLSEIGKLPVPPLDVTDAADSAAQIGSAVAQSVEKAQDYLAQLQTQIDTFGMDAMQTKFLEIQAAGADDATLGAIADAQERLRLLKEQESAAKAAADAQADAVRKQEQGRESAAGQISDMIERVEQLQGNLTDAQIALRRFSETPGVTPEQIAEFKRLQREMAGLEKAEALKHAGQQMMEQFRSPVQDLQDQVARIQELYNSGNIDILTRDAALQDAADKYGQAEGSPDKPYAGAMERGSAEAYSRILEAMTQKEKGNEQRSALDAAKRTAENTAALVELLQGDQDEDSVDI